MVPSSKLITWKRIVFDVFGANLPISTHSCVNSFGLGLTGSETMKAIPVRSYLKLELLYSVMEQEFMEWEIVPLEHEQRTFRL